MPPPKRISPEMDDPKVWETYQERVQYWLGKHNSKDKAVLTVGNSLYHATGEKNLGAIKLNGLCPRDPEWQTYDKKNKVPRFDASKDGFLSMATTLQGAGAMGGKQVVLRMKIQAGDAEKWDFRKMSETEVRTTLAIPGDRLQWSGDGGKSWSAL